MCMGCFVSLGGRPPRAPLRRAPATASAEGAQFNVPPFPATAWAEGPQLNAAPSPPPSCTACPAPAIAALDKAIPGSGQFGVLHRELANAFASGGEQRVTERRYRRWQAWLAHAGRHVMARQEVHMRLIGGLGEPRHRVVVVVGLLDLAIGCCDLAYQGDARGKDRGAFKLHLHALRVHHAAGVYRQLAPRAGSAPALAG